MYRSVYVDLILYASTAVEMILINLKKMIRNFNNRRNAKVTLSQIENDQPLIVDCRTFIFLKLNCKGSFMYTAILNGV